MLFFGLFSVTVLFDMIFEWVAKKGQCCLGLFWGLVRVISYKSKVLGSVPDFSYPNHDQWNGNSPSSRSELLVLSCLVRVLLLLGITRHILCHVHLDKNPAI